HRRPGRHDAARAHRPARRADRHRRTPARAGPAAGRRLPGPCRARAGGRHGQLPGARIRGRARERRGVMTPAERVEPRLSVVIPTYNRSGQLRRTLTTLTQQSIPPDEFEVIVAYDGSSDDTAAVVKEFADRLRVAYTYQEDLGFRA